MSRVQEIIDYVEEGVAKSIGEICRAVLEIEEEELTREEAEEIDESIFTCDVCGWTMPVDDLSEVDGFGTVCTECSDE